MSGGESTTVAGVTLTNPERVLFADQGVTKRALAEYYEAIGERILPYLEDRPVSIVRCPEGTDDQCFYQKHPTAGLEAAVEAVELQEAEGRGLYLVVRELSDLVALVQHGALEFHPWACKADRTDRPDRIVFDLDPGPGIGWQAVIRAARDVRRRLDTLGLESFVRTTGGKGLHVVAPLVRRNGWTDVHEFARALAASLTAEEPDLYTAQAKKEKREGKVFLDWLRNSRGSTAIASYSTRARAGAPVATPLAWDELDGLESSDRYTLANIRRRLAALAGDPWEGFFDLQQAVSAAKLRQARAAAGWPAEIEED